MRSSREEKRSDPGPAPRPEERRPGVRAVLRDALARSGPLLRLAGPVVVVQVGLMTMGVVDTVMVGHVSPADLAAVALGNVYFFGLALFGLGVLLGLDPVIAQAVGAGDDPAVTRGVQRGLVVAGALSVLASSLLLAAEPVLALLGQPEEVIPVAGGYALRIIPGTLPFFAFVVFRQTLQAQERVRPLVIVIVVANAANAVLNWVLVFGNLGAPAMGALGSAWATTGSRWLMALGLLAVARSELSRHVWPVRRDVFDGRALRRMLALGVPIGIHVQLEYGAFAAVALLMGSLGTVPVAAHQVAFNLAAITFMVPLGVSQAAAVLVGHGVGRGDPVGARGAATAALGAAVGFMGLTALAFVLAPELFAGLYTNDPGVLALAVALIPIAGVFQVFDGLQVACSGILRGMGDTRVPMLVSLGGFWVVGIPTSLLLAFRAGLGAQGLWWGLAAGLAAVGAVLLLRVRSRFRRGVRRVVIDEVPAAVDPAS